jgi:hypothetical protein
VSAEIPTAQKVRLPGVSIEDNALINSHLAEIFERRLRNVIRTTYYENKRAIHKIGTLIPPQYFNLGIVLGWTGKAVDGLGRRCNLESFVWADGDLASLGGSEFWNDNHLKSEVDGAITAALIHGPAFLVNTMGGEGEPASLLHVKDATEATGTWNRRTRRLDDLLSIIRVDKNANVLEMALYRNGVTLTARRDRVGTAWTVNRQDHAYGMPAEVLSYKPLPRRPFGQSRITRPIMGLQDAATRALIRLEGHMDVYSYPELWMLGADPSIFRNADGTQQTAWQIRLGRVKGIPDDEDATTPRADLKQITASSPDPHLADLNALAKMFAREASLPDSAVAITDVSNPTSAESYDASQYELISEAEGAVDDFTPALRRAFVRGLAMQNRVAAADIPDSWKSIDTKWRNPRYESKAAVADAGLKQLQAVPWLAESEVGLELIGLSDQQIQRALADRRRARGSEVLQAIRDRMTGADGDAAAS